MKKNIPTFYPSINAIKNKVRSMKKALVETEYWIKKCGHELDEESRRGKIIFFFLTLNEVYDMKFIFFRTYLINVSLLRYST